ncbi:MAG TPA: ferric reductase-like transmembrane domain-containing protein [Candidatus Nanoarchaeia archaeon]|nr:ferric reductase-like transmembrane domain-containing protein [Candidatus Nanoarchaeia archaeon]
MKPNYTLRKTIGWAVITIISLIPALLWYFLGEGTVRFNDLSSNISSLGEVFGLIGFTMFALNFVLSTRVKLMEDVFGGLDKVYIAHGILGGTALIFILAHPIFLLINYFPNDLALAAKYLIPGMTWSVNFGMIALFGLVVLVLVTLFSKMKYHRWKFTHGFMGLFFAFAVLHIFLVRGKISGDNIFDGYYVYATLVSLIGLGAFVYSLFLKNRLIKNAVYSISDIKQTSDLFIIEMKPEHKPISYKSGQFIFLRFYNQELSKEAHPFSIASKSNSNELKIVVKKLGDFTRKLEHLKVGDEVSVEGPYGRFHFRNYKDHNQIWIAAGIGITPFLGMAQDLDGKTRVDLYYVSSDNFVGLKMLKEIENKISIFRVISWQSDKNGRINANDIKKISGGLDGKEILICGSPGFKESIVSQLIELGIRKNRIHEEAFDFK